MIISSLLTRLSSGFFAALIINLFILLFLTNCKSFNKPGREEISADMFVTATAETKPVPRDSTSDAADDPAIWINFAQTDSSLIIGTDKQGGIAVYDLSGNEIFYYNTGEMNNIDLRYNFPLKSDSIDILAVSNRTDQSVDLYKINLKGSLEVIHKNQLKTEIKDEVYGLCIYKSRLSGEFYVFVNGKDGSVEQWLLVPDNDKISGKIVRRFKLDTQVEGMVADDYNGLLYVGEEDKGIWRFNAEPEGTDERELVQLSTEDNPFIGYDIEGLAIYEFSKEDGYLIVSSQGNDSYAIFGRMPPNKYLGSFRIVDGPLVDGSEETDGLELTSIPLGSKYPSGLLVVQDGENRNGPDSESQNFKIISWDSIAIRFNPALKF